MNDGAEVTSVVYPEAPDGVSVQLAAIADGSCDFSPMDDALQWCASPESTPFASLPDPSDTEEMQTLDFMGTPGQHNPCCQAASTDSELPGDNDNDG